MRGKLSYANVTATLALFAALGGVGIASIPGPDGKIEGCYADDRGSLRVVDSGAPCLAGETRITFNEKGPRGLPGPAGPRGPSGAALSSESLSRLRQADKEQADLLGDIANMFNQVERSIEAQFDLLKRERKGQRDGLAGRIRSIGKQIARLKGQARKLKRKADRIEKLVGCRTCP